ncbi:MAG: adenosylmethionine--8-amino-7-oxononanoate transaminase [Gammaproteobacteria bacterium]
MSDAASWQAYDRAHVWHPYSTLVDPPPVFGVDSAAGCRIRLADGRELIDGMASWWSAIHGYNHPDINAAVSAQLERMAHVMFGGLAHRPAAELARTLVGMTPAGLDYVFFADSGSVAIEVAIKMALQYWSVRGEGRRRRLLTLRGGYHGDTFGAMAVCDPVTGMHSLFTGVLPEHVFVPRPRIRPDEPWDDADAAPLAAALDEHGNELAAVILEPVVQGAGGMWFYHPSYLAAVRELCDRHGILLIADEIATGFGRSGTLFACDRAGISPDILCLGKALTGGYMTLAATLANETVAHTLSTEGPGVLMHGPTFMGNPLACAAASASIALLLGGDWRGNIERIERGLAGGLGAAAALPGVSDVRVLGAIGVIELEEPVDMRRIPHAFVERGVWVRPFGRLVYVMPPYVIGDDDLATLTAAMCDVVAGLGRAAS